jgi:hypothetical protein
MYSTREGQEPEGGVIPLEALKGLVDSLNRLFNIFVSRECFEVKSFRVKIRRQKLLTSFAGKDSDRAEEERVDVSVVATLESDEPAEEYMASAAELVSNIVEAGFEVSDITIALRPQEAGVEVTLPIISAKSMKYKDQKSEEKEAEELREELLKRQKKLLEDIEKLER